MRIGTGGAVTLVIACLVSCVDAGVQEHYRLKQLTNDPAQDGFSRWSPDGTSIVFSRNGAEDAPEKTGLWLVSPDGGEPHQLTTVIGEHPHWCPDGRSIVFDAGHASHPHVLVARREGHLCLPARRGIPERVHLDSLLDRTGHAAGDPREGRRLPVRRPVAGRLSAGGGVVRGAQL